MVDIFTRMLYDEGFNRNTHKLTTDILKDYLLTDHCLDKTQKLLINEVMRNPEIRNNMFRLLQEYLLQHDKGPEGLNQFMLDKSENIAMAITQMPGVRKYIKDNLHEELQKTFANEGIFNQSVDAAKGYFK